MRTKCSSALDAGAQSAPGRGHRPTRLGARCAGIFPFAVMHVPIEAARPQAREESRLFGRRLRCSDWRRVDHRAGEGDRAAVGLPILAVPTTYAGSEMTPIYGITEAGLKVPA